MSAPLSYASHALNLEKNQSMPNQTRNAAAAPASATKAKKSSANANASPASSPSPSSSPQPVKSGAAANTNGSLAKQTSAPKATAAASKPTAAAASSSSSSSKKPFSDDDDTSSGDRVAPATRTYYSGFAMVKAVLSGDTLVLAGSSSAGVETPEKVITLSGILSPKFARGKNAGSDDPWAWESREYLRKHVIGKQVKFTVQHTSDSGHAFGTVSLDGVDVVTQMLKAGFASVKHKDGDKVHADKQALLDLEADARARGAGQWRKGADSASHIRSIEWEPDVQQLFASNRNVPLPGVVDQVRDGSTLRVELIHPSNPLKHTMITLNLAGVSCPRTPLPLSVLIEQWQKKKESNPNLKEKKPTRQEPAEPFALEAQAYTETRLLNRDVQVLLQGIDKSGNLFGSVLFKKGNITQKLLAEGLGKFVPWSASLTPDAEALKQAEAQAKEANLRLHSPDASPSPTAPSSASYSSPAGLAPFEAKVLNIASSDSLVVEDADGTERRVWLASLRVPRLASRKDKKDAKDEPYAQEAKEFLRSKLIGHKVRVVPEYTRSSRAEDEKQLGARTFATIFLNKTNINESLVLAGFAEAMQHRMDEERSQFYDLYIAAEAKAKEAQRGIFDPREHVVQRVTDLTDRVRPRRPVKAKPAASSSPKDGAEADGEEDEESKEKEPVKEETKLTKKEIEENARSKQMSAKAKQYLTFLQREKQVNAVVEFVFSASRFKLLVPKEHVMISFSLAGVRTPNAKGADGKLDPFAEEVLQYVRSKVQQHSVKIEVETMDKADNYLGSLFLNRVNLAVDLLQQGYASIFGFSAAKSPYSKELYAAERAAKDARRGMWKDWVEPTPEEKAASGNADDDESKESSSTGERLARITEIVDCSDFYIQWVGSKESEAVEAALAQVAAQAEPSEPYKRPENVKGAVIAAGQFGDDTWHRVRVDSKADDESYNVYFIDFGNFDTMLADRIRELPAEATKIPPLAVHCALAGLVPPKAPEYQEGSALAFSEMAFGTDLKATIEYTDTKFGMKRYLTLSHESHPISVNRQLLRDGWAKVPSRPDRRISRLIPELKEEEQYAKDQHYNIFEYGDVSDEDEEANAVAGPDPSARPKKPMPAGGKK